jgi:hypothetical protein
MKRCDPLLLANAPKSKSRLSVCMSISGRLNLVVRAARLSMMSAVDRPGTHTLLSEATDHTSGRNESSVA